MSDQPASLLVVELDADGIPVKPVACPICRSPMRVDSERTGFVCAEVRVAVHTYGPYTINEVGLELLFYEEA